MHSVFALVAAVAVCAAPAWEPLNDPALGVEVLRPAGWTVEALVNGGVVVKAPPPLQGAVAVFPVSAPGTDPRALTAAFAARLGGTPAKEAALQGGYALQLQYTDAATPGLPRTALVAASLVSGRGLLAVLSAPDAEWDAARPALTAIAGSFRQRSPQLAGPPVPAEVANQRFAPFREGKEQAFVGELPVDWAQDLSVSIVAGASPYVRASAVGRSPDNLFAFVHYKLASFQVPAADQAAKKGERVYQAGAEVLQDYLFPAVARRAPDDFLDWKLTRRGGVQALFTHPSGVRFEGEEVEYGYRHKGEPFVGRAFVVTYLLPGARTTSWFLYALHGFEAPAGREAAARSAALRLLRSFRFEGRYAPQGDLFWSLARDAALQALGAGGGEAPAPSAVTRRSSPQPLSAVENAAQGFAEVKDVLGRSVAVQFGAAPALNGTTEVFADFAELRTAP